MSLKSTLVAISTAAVVALLVTGLKDRIALRERLGLGEPSPQLMTMGRLKEVGGEQASNADPLDSLADKVRAAAGAPPAPAPSETPVTPPVTTERAEPQSGVVAQGSPTAQGEGSNSGTTTPAAAPPPAEPKVDESALRYFAAKGDKARLQAEISRLQALYPDWVPPADPLAVPQNGDSQLEAMWRLYADGRYAEVRKAVADRRAAEPAWQPPADLLDRLNIAEARARLVNASNAKQYATVIDIGASTPSLLTCSDLDVLWRVAEAFAQSDRQARAADAYSYILKTCEDPAERLATVQKAAALLPYAAVQPLLALEKPDSNGAREFDSIRDDLARRFVAQANEDGKLDVAPDYLLRLQTAFQSQGLASDALLLGWYNLRRQQIPEAENWFRAAREKQDSASASQGLALVLIDGKRPQEAEDVMYRWRTASDDAMATYLAAVANVMALQPPADLSEAVLARMAAETVKQKYVPAAQQFGWYSRSLNQTQTAARWFETALSWKADDEPSAYGLALTRDQLNDRAGLAELQRTWNGRSPRIERLGEVAAVAATKPDPVMTSPSQPVAPSMRVTGERPALPAIQASPQASSDGTQGQGVMRTLPVRRGVRQSIAGCSATVDPTTLAPSAALARGWCLMNINRPLEAVAAFEAALSSPIRKDREDAAYGQSLAYLRAGLTSNAAVAATKAPQSRERAMELQVAILSDRAVAAFRSKRYHEALIYLDQRAQLKGETIDLMVLRGYAYFNLKMYDDAIRIFETAAATGNKDANRGLQNVRQTLYPDKTN